MERVKVTRNYQVTMIVFRKPPNERRLVFSRKLTLEDIEASIERGM